MMKFISITLSLNLMTFLINKKMINILISNHLLFILLTLINTNFLNYYWTNINLILGTDYISFSLIILNIWILSFSLLSFNLNKNFNLNFINLMMILTNLLTLSFCSMNMMIFFIFFESSLIPIILIIMGWGYQIDRIEASMYMMFYTLFGSMPLILMIMFMYMKFNTLMFNILWMNNNYLTNFNVYMYLMLNMAFFIKLPMYMTHLWLPKAHVEAPISGSMILAGIMLKLGSYGIYRSMMFIPTMFLKYNIYFLIISLIGSLISSLICLNQNDLKIIIAYSSVVHMGILLSSMMTFYFMSLKGSLLMMLAHGLCSPGMFFLANLNYSRIKSRNLWMNKGMINILPSISLWWFLIFTTNFSAPPSLNLFSEIMMFNSIIQWNYNTIMPVILISFFSTSYSIATYAFTQYGKNNFTLINFKTISCQEFLITIMHWLPLNIIFLNMNFLS